MTVTETRDVGSGGSTYPLLLALSLFLLAVGALLYMHPGVLGPEGPEWIGIIGLPVFFIGLSPLAIVLTLWTLDAVERSAAAMPGASMPSLRTGMLLFILSEIAFFAAFFASYLHYAFDPAIGGFVQWPPAAIRPVGPWGGPLINTIILVASGVFVSAAHQSFVLKRTSQSTIAIAIALILGLAFITLQAREYMLASFGYRDGVYPSNFFIATGFHGLHVIVGLTLLAVCLARLLKGNLTSDRQFGFEASVWYWHFVDAVWLMLFAIYYAWGG